MRVFPADKRSRAWAEAALAVASPLLDAPEHAHWWRHGATWFAGVNLLPNAADGSLGDTPLDGPALDALAEHALLPGRWDHAQISVVRPGYPQQDPGESDAAHRFRKIRAAAHVDGLLPVGANRRRMPKEAHAFILGLPLTTAEDGASPLVVWEDSHHLVVEAFREALGPLPVEHWSETDVTEIYNSVRRRAFETCNPREIPAAVGEAILLNRFTIHGIAPWKDGANAPLEGRIIAYFRPGTSFKDWLFGV